MQTTLTKLLTAGVTILSVVLSAAAQAPAGARGAPPTGPGPGDKQVVDAGAADRGKTTYIAECITCHGAKARGTQSGERAGDFTQSQIVELSHFLKQRFNETLRSSPTYRIQNVLTGDAKAGAQYFSGAGKCNTCHSTSGD